MQSINFRSGWNFRPASNDITCVEKSNQINILNLKNIFSKKGKNKTLYQWKLRDCFLRHTISHYFFSNKSFAREKKPRLDYKHILCLIFKFQKKIFCSLLLTIKKNFWQVFLIITLHLSKSKTKNSISTLTPPPRSLKFWLCHHNWELSSTHAVDSLHQIFVSHRQNWFYRVHV